MIVILLGQTYSLSCLSASGSKLSWAAFLKFPPKTQNGYGYMDSSTQHTAAFKVSYTDIDKKGSGLYQTLNQINTVSGIQVLAWNDQSQKKNSSTLAHSKGVIVYSTSKGEGFYIMHSIPKYPNFDSKGKVNLTIDSSEQIYGQNILCLSLSIDQIQTITGVTKYSHVNVYYNSLVNSSATSNVYSFGLGSSNTTTLIHDIGIKLSTWTVHVVSKANKINGSIFQDGLTQVFQDDFVAETWGRPLEESYCPSKDFTVQNMKTIKVGNATWSETNDHSKWAISSSAKYYVCFGDMNRMSSQWKRGGTFSCIKSKSFWTAMSSSIQQIDACPVKITSS